METLRPLAEIRQERPLRAVAALGKNWRLPIDPHDPAPRLSIESAETTLAAAEKIIRGEADVVVFLTGKTAGEYTPSPIESALIQPPFERPGESTQMRNFLRRFYTEEQIPEERIILDPTSFDTAGNADEFKKISADPDLKIGEFDLLTVGYHLRRAKRIFKSWGLKYENAEKSEAVLARLKNKRYKNFLRNAVLNKLFEKHEIKPLISSVAILGKEAVATALAYTVDRKGTGLTRKITQKSRHREGPLEK
jgi:uncharacterized SAM-binding protein YcdF (DUF218 family)